MGSKQKTDIHIRLYTPADLHSCRTLWEELTQRHRDIYADSTIDGDEPGLFFDRHLAQVGTERIWVAELDNWLDPIKARELEGLYWHIWSMRRKNRGCVF